MVMDQRIRFPFYAKASLLIVAIYFFFSILSVAENIILPLLYAVIAAILVSPIVSFLAQKGWSRVLAITSVMTVAILLLVAVVTLLISQISNLSGALPELVDKSKELVAETVNWLAGYFNISKVEINNRINAASEDLFSSSGGEITKTLTSVGSVFATLFLTPVYIFMMLFYQPHIIKAIHEIIGTNSDLDVNELLGETKGIVQSYLVGLFLEVIIVAILNSVGLMILGIEYALVLGVLGAFLNVIPYLGGIIGVTIYMIIALITKSPDYVIYVVILYSVIQFIDNNYLVPKIVGSKVKLNALISIIVVICGASLWGIPGMFLAIPLTAILKLVLDRIDSLKPWGTLLGDTMPPIISIRVPSRIKGQFKKTDLD
jgi:predicted PurR-regulated permease PerM